MVCHSPALWLGDLFRAVGELQADAKTATLVAGLLGLERSGSRQVDTRTVVYKPEQQRAEGAPHSDASFLPAEVRLVEAAPKPVGKRSELVKGYHFHVLKGHKGDVLSANFSADGKLIATSSQDGTARLWDAASGAETARLEGHGAEVTSATFSPDGRRVLTASDDRTARLWDAASGAEIARLMGHGARVTNATFSPDGRRVLTASDDRTVRLWDAASGVETARLMGHGARVTSAVFSPDGRRVLTAFDDGTVRLWDAASGAEIARLMGHGARVTSAVFSPDGRRMLTASDDRTVRLWDAASGVETARLMGHGARVTSAVFSPDGRRVLTTSDDGTARLWDPNSGRRMSVLRHVRKVNSAAFSPDGQRIVTACDDGVVRVWDAYSGKPGAQPLKHDGMVISAAFSPEGRRVVTASEDRTARLWDAASNQRLGEPSRPKRWVAHAVFSPDGRRIVTACGDGTAQLWDLAPEAAIAPLPPSTPWSAGREPDPLIPPHRLPATLRDLLATDTHDGEIDTEAAVHRMARGEPLRDLPRRKRPTLRRSVQVLEDWSEVTLPFRRDLTPLRQQLGRMFAETPPTLLFRGMPDRDELVSMEGEVAPYEPPRPGTPVLVIGGPFEGGPHRSFREHATLDDWRRFAVRLNEAGCPMVVLSPFDHCRHGLPWRQRTWEQGSAGPSRDDAASIAIPGADALFVLRELWQADPQAYRLAVLLSLATRVEPRLVRAMRRRLLPTAGTRTEAMLWSSGVVYAAVPEAFEFTVAAQTALFAELAQHRPLLDLAWGVTQMCHPDYPRILALEEEARYRSLRNRREDRAWLDETMQLIEATLRQTKRRGLAGWWARAATTLPPAVHRAGQRLGLSGLAVEVLAEKSDSSGGAPPMAELWAGWRFSENGRRRWLVLRVGKPFRREEPIEVGDGDILTTTDGEPITAQFPSGSAMQVPAGDPVVIEALDGKVGQRRRRRSMAVPAGSPTEISVSLRGSVEIIAADDSRWCIEGKTDASAVIGYYPGDKSIADDLAKKLLERGIVVEKLVDISGPGGAAEAARARPGQGIAVLGQASLEYIQRPGLHMRGHKPILATKGLLPTDLPKPLQALDHYDLCLPATGMARLVRHLGAAAWNEAAWDEAEWADDAASPTPGLSLPSPGMFHFAPPANLPLRPALREVLMEMGNAPEPLALIGHDVDLRRALAASLGRLGGVRRRFADGVFYVDMKQGDASTTILQALKLPVDRVPPPIRASVARQVLREGRCLIMVDSPEPDEDIHLTGEHGQTLILTPSPETASKLSRRPALQIGEGIEAGAVIILRHAAADRALASRLGATLQVAGATVWLLPIDKVELPMGRAAEAILLTPAAAALRRWARPNDWPVIALRYNWADPLPDWLAGATEINARDRDWGHAVVEMLL